MAFVFKYKSLYTNETYISGKIIDYKVRKEKVTLVIKGKEKVIANYYYNNFKEIKNIKYGNYIYAKGKLNSPTNNTIPNTFNYKKYLYNHKIYHTFNIESYKIKESHNILYNIKNNLYERVDKLKSKKYINALVLGNKSYLDEDEITSIKTNGIMHLFAISGMHVSLLVSLVGLLLKKINNYLKDFIILLIVFFYIFLVGFLASILRVGISLLISMVFKVLKVSISNLKNTFISFIIMLLINPLYIFDLGFIYSYTLVFFLNFYNLKSHLKTCVLTFIVSLPITIYNFYEINVLSIIINMIAIPIISYIIFPLSFIAILIPQVDNLLFLLFDIFIKANIIISHINMFKIIVGKPNIILVIILYLLFILYKRNKEYLKIILFVALVIFLSKYFSYSNKVIFFDVKQGDSLAIISRHIKDVTLIDTGGIVSFNKNSNYKVSNNIIEYLKSLGISRITTLVLTHGDFDHMGEAINLVNNFKVEKVIFNCGPYNDLEQELIEVLDKKKIPYYLCIKELNIDNNKLYFLQTKEYDNENDNSNVIYTELNGYKFMFMGDASIATENEIMSKYNLLDIDVLKVGHHGSKTSSSVEFINEINPKYSIISVGKNNRYGHPNNGVLDNLENSKIYRTDEDGSIMFKIKNNKLKIETCSP